MFKTLLTKKIKAQHAQEVAELNLRLFSRTKSRDKYMGLFREYRTAYTELRNSGEKLLADARIVALENSILRGKVAALENKLRERLEKAEPKLKIGDRVRIVYNKISQNDPRGINWMDEEEKLARSTRVGRVLRVREVGETGVIRCYGLHYWHPAEKFELVESPKNI